MAYQPPRATFPEDLPARKNRSCPGMRNFFSISISSYSLKTSDKAILARRICALTILILRTALNIRDIVWSAITGKIFWLVINIVLGIIGFFFIAWALAAIVEAQGRRKVLGMLMGRWHLDVFLLIVAIIHAGVFIGGFFGLSGDTTSLLWISLWLLIFLGYWITTRVPVEESSV
ncbi:hypothetical protein BU23DRAFT_519303 [Bimuria novae-zelandiae CBS 107.79]|uniref:Uncharacterized protein n=1 Tax=Bimuria novae-zelandiae CBS 107.79 TaxID=1447943 RepID=A0A6A5UP11_9PLEO|nr:hypothetical protein BU23DRAFT_519303 [Bimuria novae-zelandiae CBS 107.79]